MKKFSTIALIVLCSHVFAQDSLKTFNESRIHVTSSGMKVLGGWGMVNLITGAVGLTRSNDPEGRYFHQMNLIWGGVNFGTGLLTYASLQKSRKRLFTAAQTAQEQNKVERIFLINGGFDIAYIGTGLYLKLAGNSRNSPIMKGYGESVLLQGGFLLLFDGLMYQSERSNGNKLRTFLEKHPIAFDGKRLGIIFNM